METSSKNQLFWKKVQKRHFFHISGKGGSTENREIFLRSSKKAYGTVKQKFQMVNKSMLVTMHN